MANQIHKEHSLLLCNLRFCAVVARIASYISCLGAGLALILITGKPGWSYGAISRYYSRGRQFVGPATCIEQGPVTPVPTRKADQLKQEEQQIKRSIARLQQHYSALRAAAEAALLQPAPQMAVFIRKTEEAGP